MTFQFRPVREADSPRGNSRTRRNENGTNASSSLTARILIIHEEHNRTFQRWKIVDIWNYENLVRSEKKELYDMVTK